MSTRRIIGIVVAFLVFCGAGFLRAADLNQVHCNFTDTAKAAEWYAKYMGGTLAKMGQREIVSFGKVNLLSYQKDAPIPGSEGSAIDHIGFSFTDLDAKMKELEAAGVKVLMPVRSIGKVKVAFIEDPWGVKIEVMQDPDIVGFHHVHLAAPDPNAMIQWFADSLGGEPFKFMGMMPALKYGDITLLASKATGELAPTMGRAIDHIGFGVTDMDELANRLKEKGTKFTTEPRSLGAAKVAFIEGPNGIRIELIQPAPAK